MRVVYLLAFLIVSGTILGQSINDSLLIYYPFDGNAKDFSGNNYNGKELGVIYVKDRFGNLNSACYFDGINDYVEFPNLKHLKPNLPVSFSFWVKFNSVSIEKCCVFNTSFVNDQSAGVFFNTQSSTGKYGVSFGDGANYYSPLTRRTYVCNSIVDSAAWHHIVIILNDVTDMKIYVDCLDQGGTYSGSGGELYYSNNPGIIGRHDRNTNLPSYYLHGIIDEFRYWNKELSISEIDTLCNHLFEKQDSSSNDSIPFYETIPKIDSLLNKGLLIFPNPAFSFINFVTKLDDLSEIEIFDITGKKVFTCSFKSRLNIGFLATGMYIFKVTNKDNSKIFKQKIIVSRNRIRYFQY